MKKSFILLWALLFAASAACADVPSGKLGDMELFSPTIEEVPSVKLGDMEIYSLLDARATAPASLLIGATDEQIVKYAPNRIFHGQVMAFLVKLPGKTVLFDTGAGAALGGQLMNILAKLNIAPEQVDAVVMTHLHADHIGGLIDREGKAAFPNAALYVSRIEKNYWCDQLKLDFVIAAVAPYEKRLHLFEFGDTLLECITAIDGSGHTPGHTVFDIKRDDGELLVVGDILHFDGIMLDEPHIAIAFDEDPVKAPITRQRILDMAAEKKLPVAGPHFSGTGLWNITKTGNGYEKSPL